MIPSYLKRRPYQANIHVFKLYIQKITFLPRLNFVLAFKLKKTLNQKKNVFTKTAKHVAYYYVTFDVESDV